MTAGTGRLARVAGAAALVLGLAACTGDERDAPREDEAPQTSAGGEATPDARDALDGFRVAADTALGEVDGAVVAVGREADAWDVLVVTADGSEHEVDLSADGTIVTRHRVETAAEDPDDAAERRRLLGGPVDHRAAIEAALGEVDGDVTSVELSEGDGTVVWEVEMDEETPDAVTVAVDAGTGEVVGTERGQ